MGGRSKSRAFSIPAVEASDDEQVVVVCSIFVIIALGMWWWVGSDSPPAKHGPKRPKVTLPVKRKSTKLASDKAKKPEPKKVVEVKEEVPEEFDTLTGLSPTMQKLLIGGAAVPTAAGLYYLKKRRDRKIAESTVTGKMKAKLGKKLFYVVSLTGITAVGGWLMKRFKPEWYQSILAKLPDCFPFSYLKGEKKDDKKGKKSEKDADVAGSAPAGGEDNASANGKGSQPNAGDASNPTGGAGSGRSQSAAPQSRGAPSAPQGQMDPRAGRPSAPSASRPMDSQAASMPGSIPMGFGDDSRYYED